MFQSRLLAACFAAQVLSSMVAQPGALDPTFGSGGKVLADIGRGQDRVNAVLIQPDGRIVSAGGAQYFGWGCFALMRHLPDGSFDPTFGVNGIATTTLNANNGPWELAAVSVSEVLDLALLPDGRIIAVGRAFTVFNGSGWNRLGLARYHPDGSLDETFSDDGWLVELLVPGFDARVAVLSDGRIVVAAGSGYGDFHVLRYNTDGTRDTSFDGDGLITHQFGTATNEVRGLGVMPDGRIIVGGNTFANGTDLDIFLARFTVDGALDPTFNGTGELISAPGVQNDQLNDLIVHDDGSVILVGSTRPTPTMNQWLLQRFLPDGTPDVSFGDGGTTIHVAGTNGGDLWSVAERSDGVLLTAGTRYDPNGDYVAAAFTALGDHDLDYGNAGYCSYTFTPQTYFQSAIATGDAGQAVVACTVSPGTGIPGFDIGLASITAEGVLDSVFNGTGSLVQDLGIGGDMGRCVALQPDGKIISGEITDMDNNIQGVITRFNADGSLDTGFGTDGHVLIDDAPLCIAVQPDGRILVGLEWSFSLCRLQADGVLDLSFNGTGYQYVGGFFPVDGASALRRIIVQPDGRIIAGGLASSGSWERALALARLNPDGTLDPTFGGDGKVLTNLLQNNWDELEDIALMPDGRIVAAGWASGSGLLAVRYETDGDMDPTFGGGSGIVSNGLGGNIYARSYRVVARPDGKVILAGNGQLTGFPYTPLIAIHQLLTDGSLDSGFGTNGQIVLDDARLESLSLQPDGKLLLAGYHDPGDGGDFLLSRLGTGGQLDPGFGDAGSVTTAFDSNAERASGMALQPDGKVVLVGFAQRESDFDLALARYELGAISGVAGHGSARTGIQVWPAPLTTASVVRFTIAEATSVTLNMLDAQGRTVLNILETQLHGAGEHIIPIPEAQRLAHGHYTLLLRTPSGNAAVRIVR